MSQPEAGSSRRRSKYASRACNTCRRRKSKCDGIQPICQPCAVTGHECSWATEGDETNRPATKQLVEGLRAKIQILESEVAQLRRQKGQYADVASSSIPLACDGALTSMMMTEYLSSSGSLSQTSTPQMEDDLPLAQYIHLTPPQPSSDPSHDPVIQPHPIPPIGSNQPHSPVLLRTLMTELDGTPPSLTYRYIFDIDFSIALEAQSPGHRASLECHWDRYLPDLGAIQFSRHEHDTLLSRCFSYGSAWLFGLIPDLFLSDMLEFLSPNISRVLGDLQHYSPLLHCSLLAFITPLSDDSAIRAPSTRRLFAMCAKQWLDQEFSFLNPSLLPSLVMLSEYHLGVGERNTGDMYIGMSVRAARAGYATASPVRDWYHWSTFIQEKFIAQEMQRPSEMPVPTILIAPPIPIELGGVTATGEPILDMLGHGNFTGIAAHCFVESIKLLLISLMIPNVLQGGPTPIDVHIELDAWFNSLPDGLLIRQRSTFTPPPILALHIRYWWSILDLYLPFFDSTDQAANQPIKICNRATEKLVKLFGSYDTQFGFRYFPRNLLRAIHTCCRGLLMERAQVNEGTKKRASAQEGINLCLRGLRSAGENWSGTEPLVRDLEGWLASSLDWMGEAGNN